MPLETVYEPNVVQGWQSTKSVSLTRIQAHEHTSIRAYEHMEYTSIQAHEYTSLRALKFAKSAADQQTVGLEDSGAGDNKGEALGEILWGRRHLEGRGDLEGIRYMGD